MRAQYPGRALNLSHAPITFCRTAHRNNAIEKYATKHQARFEILKFQNQNSTLSRSFARPLYRLAIKPLLKFLWRFSHATDPLNTKARQDRKAPIAQCSQSRSPIARYYDRSPASAILAIARSIARHSRHAPTSQSRLFSGRPCRGNLYIFCRYRKGKDRFA